MKVLWLLNAAALFWVVALQAKTVTTHPYVGITYITRTETSPRQVTMHIAQIDLSAPGLAFKLTPHAGARDTLRETTLDFLNREHAQLAVNGHFFLPFPSDDTDANVIGLAASQGIVFSPFEPQPIGTGYVDQSYAILPYAPALNIDPLNRATIVHHDPGFADNKHVLEPVRLWNTVAGSAQIVCNGMRTIPTYSGSPNGLTPGDDYSDADSWYSYPEARTSIGLTADAGTLVLFTVDETDGSDGMTPGEVADLLIKDYEVYNAFNLDGGGSTTMALQDPTTHVGHIVNVSSDDSAGRKTGSNLAVFAWPNSPSAVLPALTITRTNGFVISWPASPTGMRLQESSGMNPAKWSNVSASPTHVGDRMQIKITPQTGSRFYRLKQ